jgi:hypothetical protein
MITGEKAGRESQGNPKYGFLGSATGDLGENNTSGTVRSISTDGSVPHMIAIYAASE